MSRTISEIYDEIIQEKNTMSSLTNLQPNIDSSQSLLSDLTSTSKVAVWRLMFWVFAFAIWSHEKLFDNYKNEIEDLASEIVTGTKKWYWAQCFLFQFGDTLQWLDNKYKYASVDSNLQIIKRASVIEAGGQVRLKVAKLDANDMPIPLTSSELSAFQSYISQIKFAGTSIAIISADADQMKAYYDVYYDPQVLSPSGELLSTPGVYPVEEAINSYVSNLPFDGILNITSLTDVVQSVEGVIDPVFQNASAKYGVLPYEVITNNYNAYAGYIKIDPAFPLSSTINYIPYV